MNNWEKAQVHERKYYESGNNLQWNTPHGFNYWLKFLGLTSLPDNVLEIGCGPNGLWRFSENVTGLDPIDYSRYGENFIEGKGESIPVESETYDLIVCCNSLDHCEDPKRVVSEMIRVLKPDGKLVIWSNIFPKWIIPILKIVDEHPYHFTSEYLSELIPLKKTRYDKILFTESHLNYVVDKWARFKLMVAELLGVHGVLIHYN